MQWLPWDFGKKVRFASPAALFSFFNFIIQFIRWTTEVCAGQVGATVTGCPIKRINQQFELRPFGEIFAHKNGLRIDG